MSSQNKFNRDPPKNFYHPFIAIAVVILSVFSYIFLTATPEISSKVGNYIQVLTLIIFTVTGVVTLRTFKNQTDDRARMAGIQYANLTQGKVSEIDKMFMANPLLDRLYLQIYSHDPHIKKITKMRGPITENANMLKTEHLACNLIFQKMADIYACEKLDLPTDDCIEWINTFRSWMKSPILRSHWSSLKYEQHPEFRRFVQKCLITKNQFIKNIPLTKVPQNILVSKVDNNIKTSPLMLKMTSPQSIDRKKYITL